MKFHSSSVAESVEVPLADEGLLEALVARFSERAKPGLGHAAGASRCYVLVVQRPDDDDLSEARLAEITGLIDAQGDHVVGSECHLLSKPDPRTLVRVGVAERVAEAARAAGANMLVVDAELSPSQTRNLEAAVGLPICDREAVILNVFQRHAATRRARTQVEIAHLQYLRPRIRGIGLNMDQQMGGSNKARGPGETASELLARQLDGRLAELRRRLQQLKQADAANRKQRSTSTRVALVGYTNAGKTSLMNALTDAELSVRNRPFETLDTTSRCLTRHGGDVLLSDTVGFIRRLPERLFASFESTLAEVSEASLLLVVLDASDPEVEAQLATTLALLERLGAAETERFIVFNKRDRVSAMRLEEVTRLAAGCPYALVSSQSPADVAALRERVLERARSGRVQRELFVPYALTDVSREVYAQCRVIESEASERGVRFVLEGEPHIVAALVRSIKEVK
jgi:GTPase